MNYKVSPKDLVSKIQGMYKKDGVVSTGASLKRPTNPEDFVLMPKDHPWCEFTGLMGIPLDMIIEVAGEPDAGKSTLAGEAMAEAQKQGIYVILWDTEKKFDRIRFTNQFGGDPDEIIVVGTTVISKGAGAVIKAIRAIKEADKDARIMFVWDSIGGSISRSQADRDLDDEKSGQPGQEAKENSNFMKVLCANFDKYPGTVAALFINQLTDKIGFMQSGKTTTGGHKIKFHASMRIYLKKIKTLLKQEKGKKVKVGIITQATMEKNHLSQTEKSIHQMNWQVTAKGISATDFSFDKKKDEDNEED